MHIQNVIDGVLLLLLRSRRNVNLWTWRVWHVNYINRSYMFVCTCVCVSVCTCVYILHFLICCLLWTVHVQSLVYWSTVKYGIFKLPSTSQHFPLFSTFFYPPKMLLAMKRNLLCVKCLCARIVLLYLGLVVCESF